MKGDVRFESYGNGRRPAWMWWGGVECYLREIRQDLPRHFLFYQPPRASGNLLLHTEHRGGLRKQHGDWHCEAPSALDWLTDWPLCISKCLHLFVPRSLWKNAFYFRAGPFHECLPMICVITEQTEDSIWILFCRHCNFPFIYQYESPIHQVVWSVEWDVPIQT